MGLKKAENQVKILLAETILSMCRNTLPYHAEICVEGLLGITLDNEEIFLVNINQTIKNQIEGPSAASKANESLKRSRKEQDNEGSESDPESSSNESEESSSKKRRKRGRRKKQKGEKSGSESDDGNLADESANVEATSLLPGADPTEVKFHNISPPDENPDGSEQYYDNSNQTADNDSQDATPSGVNVTVKQEPPGGPESDDDLVFVKQEVDDFNLAQPSSHQFSNLSQVFGNSSADTSLSQPDFMSSAFFNNPANNMSANAMQQAAVPGPSGANAGLEDGAISRDLSRVSKAKTLAEDPKMQNVLSKVPGNFDDTKDSLSVLQVSLDPVGPIVAGIEKGDPDGFGQSKEVISVGSSFYSTVESTYSSSGKASGESSSSSTGAIHQVERSPTHLVEESVFNNPLVIAPLVTKSATPGKSLLRSSTNLRGTDQASVASMSPSSSATMTNQQGPTMKQLKQLQQVQLLRVYPSVNSQGNKYKSRPLLTALKPHTGAVRANAALVPGSDMPKSMVPGSEMPRSVMPRSLVPGSAMPRSLVPRSLVPGSVVPRTVIPRLPGFTGNKSTMFGFFVPRSVGNKPLAPGSAEKSEAQTMRNRHDQLLKDLYKHYASAPKANTQLPMKSELSSKTELSIENVRSLAGTEDADSAMHSQPLVVHTEETTESLIGSHANTGEVCTQSAHSNLSESEWLARKLKKMDKLRRKRYIDRPRKGRKGRKRDKPMPQSAHQLEVSLPGDRQVAKHASSRVRKMYCKTCDRHFLGSSICEYCHVRRTDRKGTCLSKKKTATAACPYAVPTISSAESSQTAPQSSTLPLHIDIKEEPSEEMPEIEYTVELAESEPDETVVKTESKTGSLE